MSEDHRATLTTGLWFLSSIVLAALFISAAAQGELTSGHILLAFVILSLVVMGTGILFYGQRDETQETKAKRHRIESLLSDMSEEDLIALKQRLSNIERQEEPILDYIDDDGELVLKN